MLMHCKGVSGQGQSKKPRHLPALQAGQTSGAGLFSVLSYRVINLLPNTTAKMTMTPRWGASGVVNTKPTTIPINTPERISDLII